METQTWEIDVGTSSHREIVEHSDGAGVNISVTCQNRSHILQDKTGRANLHLNQKGEGCSDRKKKNRSLAPEKIKICDFYKKSGDCKFQEKCFFSHDLNTNATGEVKQKSEEIKNNGFQPKPKTPPENGCAEKLIQNDSYLNINSSCEKLCQFFSTQNGCKFGDRCTFTHYRSVSDAAKEDVDTNNAPVIESNAKKCIFFQKSRGCVKGDQCDFSHLIKEDTKKEQLPFAEEHDEKEQDNVTSDLAGNSNAEDLKIRKPCRFFALSRGCRLKEKCPFLHTNTISNSSQDANWRKISSEGHIDEKGETAAEVLATNETISSSNDADEVSGPDNHLTTCRFFLSPKGCFRGAKCTFLHPGKGCSMEHTDGSMTLQEREFKQLEKRFSAEGKCTLIQSEGSRIYSVLFEPSDPDWGIVVKEFELTVEFPEDYPKQMFNITLKDKEIYPERFTNFMNYGIQEWIKGREQERDASDLAFRPFLKWFDRNAEELVLEAGRKVKQLRDAESCGITLIPHDNIIHQNSATESSNDEEEDPEDDEDAEKVVQGVLEEEEYENEHDQQNTDEVNQMMSSDAKLSNESSGGKLSTKVKTGTEVKFTHMEMSENVATLQLKNVMVVVQCVRCKAKTDFNLVAKKKSTAPCRKCHVNQSATFYPEIVHQYSHVAGYLHLDGCKAFDVVLIDSNIVINCLSCSKDHTKKGLAYGRKSDHWCVHCHAKMEIQIMASKFVQLQKNGDKVVEVKASAKKPVKYPGIKEGNPLPEKGTCKHYKKSYRWLRFPCCGKVYPCDVCHEEGEENDHEMKFATRMICGYCSKEQPFAKDKPCINCKSNVTKSKSSHWEGGKGCRSKVAMSRSDNKKTAGLGKTISRKKADS